MARFRAPSSSFSSRGSSMESINATHRYQTPIPSQKLLSIAEEEGSNHRPKPPARNVKQGKGRARKPARMDVGKKDDIRMAMKKAELDRNKLNWAFVYVGNLSSAVNEEQLEATFGHLGPMRRIQIRASSGICVPTMHLPKPYWGFGAALEGVHYATVGFTSSAFARQALQLSGLVLAGRKIMISFNVADLPQTAECLMDRLKEKERYADKRSAWKERFGQLKRLTIEKTEYISRPKHIPYALSPADRRPNQGPLVAGAAKRLGKLLPAAGGHAAPFSLCEALM